MATSRRRRPCWGRSTPVRIRLCVGVGAVFTPLSVGADNVRCTHADHDRRGSSSGKSHLVTTDHIDNVPEALRMIAQFISSNLRIITNVLSARRFGLRASGSYRQSGRVWITDGAEKRLNA
jgi:hypothetical protein